MNERTLSRLRRNRNKPTLTEKNEELDFVWRFLYLKIFQYFKNLTTHYRGHLQDSDSFNPIASHLDADELKTMFNKCTTPAVRIKLLNQKEGTKVDISGDNPNDILRMLWECPHSNAKFRVAIGKYLDGQISRLNASLEKEPDAAVDRFKQLGDLFKLEPVELELLILSRVVVGDLWFSSDLHGDLSFGKMNRFACSLGISFEQMQKISKTDGRLRRLNCIDENLMFNNELLQYLSGVDDEPLVNRYFTKNEKPVLPWNYYGELAEKHGDFLKNLIKSDEKGQGINILLYGEPGTGKTSFACSLAAELGLNAYFVAQSSSKGEGKHCDYSNNFRFAALHVCGLQVEPQESLIIIDEADKMLGSGGPFLMMFDAGGGDKGMLNSVMDTTKHPCIWITNTSAKALDLSSRRRFDYSIKFEKLTTMQRALIWKNAAEKYGIADKIPEDALSKFAARYEISAGGIDLTLRNYSKLPTGNDLEKTITKLLEPHCELMGVPDENTKFIAASDYCLDGLNIKGNLPLQNIAPAIHRFRSETSGGIDRPRMNLLLSGPPGTGKTEFVKYLGKTLDCKVLVKMGSDLLDMYVGGTEQNLKRAFAEAEAEKAILFLDEIDGMLQTREKAQRSWEVTQVNELLYQMENFNGVLIGATNFVKNLDQATLRRFTFKLEFDYLNDAGKKIFFERMFKLSITPEEEFRLQAIPNLAPGDFRTVRQGLYYLNPQEIKVSDLLEGLERESAMKNGGGKTKAIGF